MGKAQNGYRNFFKFRLKHAVLSVAVIAALLQPLSAAHAGFLDRVKDIYQMPEQIGDMEMKYNETKQQLDAQKEQLTEQQNRLAESIEQNRRLQEQNAALQRRLQMMEEAKQAADARTRKLIYTGITAAILIAGYFLLGRLLRVAVWRRGKGNIRFK